MAQADDHFERLGAQIDQAAANIKASASQSKAQLEAEVEAARRRADEQAEQLRTQKQSGQEQAESRWRQVQGDWNAHVERIRQRIDEKKAELDLKDAERETKWAEADADAAIDFVAAAIQEAEYAVLDAYLARMNADAISMPRPSGRGMDGFRRPGFARPPIGLRPGAVVARDPRPRRSSELDVVDEGGRAIELSRCAQPTSGAGACQAWGAGWAPPRSRRSGISTDRGGASCGTLCRRRSQ